MDEVVTGSFYDSSLLSGVTFSQDREKMRVLSHSLRHDELINCSQGRTLLCFSDIDKGCLSGEYVGAQTEDFRCIGFQINQEIPIRFTRCITIGFLDEMSVYICLARWVICEPSLGFLNKIK